MVSRIVIIGSLLIGSCFAQRSDTVFYQVVSNSNVPSQIALPASANIGQPYHLLYAIFSDIPGHTCTHVTTSGVPPLININAGSSTNFFTQAAITNYARVITPNSGSAIDRYRMIASAAGAYPFLSVQFDHWDTTNCNISILYTGSLSSIDIKKYADFGTFTDTLTTVSFATAASGDNVIVPSNCSDCRLVIYSLVLFNQTAQTLTIKDGTSTLLQLSNFCAGCQLVLPNTNYPIMTTITGGSITLNLSAATGVSAFIGYRVE